SATTQSPPVPNAPIEPAATGISQSKVLVEWTDLSSDEAGFKIERSLDGVTGWSVIAQAAANTESFTDSLLAAGTLYFYRVCAFNPSGNSLYTSAVSTMTQTARTLKLRAPNAFVRGHQGSLFVDLDSVGTEGSIAFSVLFPTATL